MEHVRQVMEHFWVIDEGGVRSFLFEGNDQALLVDTGFGELPMREIAAGLTALPVMLVNTHTDRDHTGRNREFSPVYMHPAEMDHYRKSLPEGCRIEDVRPLWEGDVIDLGRWRFEVVLTPGHTPGSIMLLEREKRMLISGDTVQNGDIFLFGEGRNVWAFQHSLEKLIAMSGEFDTIYPSHGSYPLGPGVIPGILQGCRDLLAGELPEQDPPFPMPCRKYPCGAASFCYQFD